MIPHSRIFEIKNTPQNTCNIQSNLRQKVQGLINHVFPPAHTEGQQCFHTVLLIAKLHDNAGSF